MKLNKKIFFPIFIFLGINCVCTLTYKFHGGGGIGNLLPEPPLSWAEILANLPWAIFVSTFFTFLIVLLMQKVRKDVDKNREIELERLNNIVKFQSPTQTHECRICGCWLEEYPWGEDGKSPSYELCPCCGVQFGKEDIIPQDIKQYRTEWKKKGYKWYDKSLKPDSWDLNEQMKKIPNG